MLSISYVSWETFQFQNNFTCTPCFTRSFWLQNNSTCTPYVSRETFLFQNNFTCSPNSVGGESVPGDHRYLWIPSFHQEKRAKSFNNGKSKIHCIKT